eukprot:PITA_17486
MSGNIKGSYIRNKAWDNRSLVQDNSFWEIREGDLALFGEDKWQQEQILLKEDFMCLKQETDSQGLTKVKDLWTFPHDTGKWRNWRIIDCRDESPIKTKTEALMGILKQRKILVSEGPDQLRWGLNKEGTFNLREAKRIIFNLDSFIPNNSWQQLWSQQGWMKTDRDKGSVINTLNKWRRNFSENELLNLTWAFTPSFIILNVWKERNKRIFKGEQTTPLHLLGLILKQIKETVSTTIHNFLKNPPTNYDLKTLIQLGLHELITQDQFRKAKDMDTEKNLWHPPLKGYLKCNIDGSSKGNPRTIGYGGVLRDEDGNIIFVFHCHLGITTNNMAELMALEHYLELLKQTYCSTVSVEADSEISINAVKRINCGIAPEKVSKHWRLIQVYQRIQNHLLSLRTVSFNHV